MASFDDSHVEGRVVRNWRQQIHSCYTQQENKSKADLLSLIRGDNTLVILVISMGNF